MSDELVVMGHEWDGEPWEQLPGESTTVFNSFRVFRDMGTLRTLKDVAVETGLAYQTIKEHSSQWQWASRANAYDQFMDRTRVQAFAEEVAEMGRRQARQGLFAQELGMAGLEDLKRKIDQYVKEREEAGEDAPSWEAFPLAPKDALAMLETGSKLERVARGEPDLTVSPAKNIQERANPADPQWQQIALDPDVQEAGRALLERASAAREDQSGGAGHRDDPDVP